MNTVSKLQSSIKLGLATGCCCEIVIYSELRIFSPSFRGVKEGGTVGLAL